MKKISFLTFWGVRRTLVKRSLDLIRTNNNYLSKYQTQSHKLYHLKMRRGIIFAVLFIFLPLFQRIRRRCQTRLISRWNDRSDLGTLEVRMAGVRLISPYDPLFL